MGNVKEKLTSRLAPNVVFFSRKKFEKNKKKIRKKKVEIQIFFVVTFFRFPTAFHYHIQYFEASFFSSQ